MYEGLENESRVDLTLPPFLRNSPAIGLALDASESSEHRLWQEDEDTEQHDIPVKR